MNFEREYKRLNKAQKEAVDTIDGPLIVIAGPGTGKTQLLSMRTANILKQTDILPENILCLTFTEAASENMRTRLTSLIGKSANKVSIFTFHGFGTSVIQNYSEFFYDAPLLNQLNQLGEYELLEKLMNKLHHNNPLAKKIDNAFLHLPSVISTISWLKKAGLTADELRLQTIQNQEFFKSALKAINEAFQSSPSAKDIDKYNKLHSELLSILKSKPNQVGELAAEELESAIDEIEPGIRFAKPITAWRNRWLNQVKKGQWQFADQQKNEFLTHLAGLYENYQKALADSGLYTFDDMILRTVQAMNQNEELKLNLQERYQYILVDEYQDTNAAQDSILDLLADNPVNEGQPNLMVVGDDDQAIYRFQGAENSVMVDFIKKWQPKRIVLTESYRSSQLLLDLSRQVILNAEDRLENFDPTIIKKLESRSETKSSDISELTSPTEIENYINVSSKIKSLISNGTKPSSIAVLAPKHRYLEELVPYLFKQDIPFNYERQEQILEQPRIVELLDLISLVSAASTMNLSKIKALLPKIIAAEYWQIDADDLWQIAIDAQADHKGWLKVMEESELVDLNNFAKAIKILAKDAKNQSFDLLLAYLMGAKPIKLGEVKEWDLPWRDYYFSKDQLDSNPDTYISFMSQLDVLRQTFREWQPNTNRVTTIEDFESFIKLFSKSKIKLSDTNPYTTAKDAVDLMTAFKAKGLEWDSVFILNIEEDVWGSKARSRHNTFSLPSTLKWIEPASDSDNDLIRLLYVGLTRARNNLHLSDYEVKNTGHNAERLVWLDELLAEPTPLKSVPASLIVDSPTYNWSDKYMNLTNDLGLLLKPILDSYRLSSTHINDFLAVDRGGPKHFFYRHILRVPDELNNSAIYGDSVHKTLEYIHNELASSQQIPDEASVNTFFESKLSLQPLTTEDFQFFKKRGIDTLTDWMASKKDKLSPSDLSEKSFSSDQIVVNGARLTGKIDVIRKLSGNEVCVVDYKTSQPIDDWAHLSGNSAIRANNYKRQLLFYKLLVDNSVSLPRTTAKTGSIEFISPDDENNFIELSYDYNNTDVDRVTKLVGVIWKKILNLDFPDTDSYPPTIKGIKLFEDDLIDGKI